MNPWSLLYRAFVRPFVLFAKAILIFALFAVVWAVLGSIAFGIVWLCGVVNEHNALFFGLGAALFALYGALSAFRQDDVTTRILRGTGLGPHQQG